MKRRHNLTAWLGLGLGILGVVGYFVLIVAGWGSRGLRDSALLNLIIVGIGLGVSAVGISHAFGRRATHRGRILAPLLGVLNLLLVVLFVNSLYGAAALPEAPAAPVVGQVAPDFQLADQTGKTVQLSSLRGKNVLVVAYRGHW